MLPYGAKDLAAAFRTVRNNTLTAAEELPEDRLDFSPAPGTRTVRQLLAHIANVDQFSQLVHGEKRTTLKGFNFPEMMAKAAADEQQPRAKAELIALLKQRGESFAAWLETLSDDFLAERVEMPAGASPAAKTRFEMLMGVKEHEMHHRGQLMLIQRMLGVVPHLTRQRQERFAASARA